MAEPKIKRAESGKSKGKTFTNLLGTYRKAMREGFYGEAELILYAFMEDRLKSFIDYSEGMEAPKLNNITSEKVRSLFPSIENVKDISSKCKLIRKMLNLADKDPYDTEYSRELSNLYSKYIDVKEFKAVLKGIDKWCGYRNEHVHAMFNKDLEDLRANYKAHVEDGYELARYIDNQVKRIKSV